MSDYSKKYDLAASLALVVSSFLFMMMCFSPNTKIGWVNISPKAFRILIGVIVLLSLIRLGSKRDYYLPFLGDTAFPCDPLTEKAPLDADISVNIHTEPNRNIVYWASDGKYAANNPITAYGTYSNSGVTRSDDLGNAVLRVRKPIPYKIPNGKTLQSHIHYRVCIGNGLLGRVETVEI